MYIRMNLRSQIFRFFSKITEKKYIDMYFDKMQIAVLNVEKGHILMSTNQYLA